MINFFVRVLPVKKVTNFKLQKINKSQITIAKYSGCYENWNLFDINFFCSFLIDTLPTGTKSVF